MKPSVAEKRVEKLIAAACAWLKEAKRLGIQRDEFKGPALALWDAAEPFYDKAKP